MSTPNFGSLPALSTNAPYLLAVWDEVVASRNVVAVCKTFPIVSKAQNSLSTGSKDEGGKAEVKVDVVSENGRKWSRINTCVWSAGVVNNRLTKGPELSVSPRIVFFASCTNLRDPAPTLALIRVDLRMVMKKGLASTPHYQR
jgi:hypothetical protein